MAFNNSNNVNVNSDSSGIKSACIMENVKLRNVCVHHFVKRAHLQIDVITNLRSRIEEKRKKEREKEIHHMQLSEFKTGQKQNWKSEKEKKCTKDDAPAVRCDVMR